MKINKKELLEVLQKLLPAISKKDIVEQATHFIFADDYITTYNDQISIKHPFKSEIICSVPAEKFYKLLLEINSQELDISLEENILFFNTKKAKVKLNVNTNIDKSLLIETNDDWKSLPKDFLEAILFCSFSASKDMTYIQLNYLNIDENKVQSTDNYRITEYIMKSEIEDSFLLLASAAKELAKFSIKEYSISNSWLFFRTEDNVIFSCRRIEANFPNISNLLEEDGENIILPDETKEAINVSSILTQADFNNNRKIQVTIKNGILSCIGESDIGSAEYSIESKDLIGQDFDFIINPDFFQIILSKCKSVYIKKNMLLFKSENFKHIISLF